MKLFPILTATAAVALGLASPALAAEPTLSFPTEDTAGGPVGSTLTLRTADVEDQFVGIECDASVEILNQGSSHPNNDLIITSGGNSVEVADIEGETFSDEIFVLPIVLGETVSVAIRFGGDGFFSGGFIIDFDCSAGLPTTTVAPTTTLAPETTLAPATTAAPDTTAAPTTTIDDSGVLPDSSADPTTTTTPTIPAPTTAPADPGTGTTEPGSGTPDPGEVLPATGRNLTTLLLGASLVAAGVGAVLGARRRFPV